MKYSEKLIEIVRNKKFKSFWHCLDYLMLAGYNSIDAYGITVKEFGSDLFSKVAFGHTNIDGVSTSMSGTYAMRVDPVTGMVRDQQIDNVTLIVGLIDETNIHLDSLYADYRKWWKEEKFLTPQFEIESTCEIIKITSLTPFVLNHINSVSQKYFGYALFKIPEYGNRAPHNPNDYTIHQTAAEFMRRQGLATYSPDGTIDIRR